MANKQTILLTTPAPAGSPSPGPGPGPGAEPLPGRPLQITMQADVGVLLARLCARWVEKGHRPSKCSKTAVIADAIRALAKAEGIDLSDLTKAKG